MKLNFFENKVAPFLAPTQSITFYEGTAPKAFLLQRVAEIISANPWLAGSLRNPRNGIEIVLPCSIDEHRHFQEATIPGLMPEMHPANDLIPKLSPYCVKAGVHDESLFKVTLVHISPTRFAVLTSMSHMIADGHTYYNILGMLGTDGVVKALDATRKAEYTMDTLRTVFGQEKVDGFFSPYYFVGAVLMPILRLCVPYAPWKVQYEVRIVNRTWLAEQKKHYNSVAIQAGVPFVSTNDILTSWFLKHGPFNSGSMAVNLRNRTPGITDEDIGNYEFAIHYFPDQWASPMGIRKALFDSSVGTLRTSRSKFLAPNEALSITEGIVSNLTSFYQSMTLPNSKQIWHMPLISVPLANRSASCAIFQATPDQLGVYIVGPKSAIQPALDSEALAKLSSGTSKGSYSELF